MKKIKNARFPWGTEIRTKNTQNSQTLRPHRSEHKLPNHRSTSSLDVYIHKTRKGFSRGKIVCRNLWCPNLLMWWPTEKIVSKILSIFCEWRHLTLKYFPRKTSHSTTLVVGSVGCQSVGIFGFWPNFGFPKGYEHLYFSS